MYQQAKCFFDAIAENPGDDTPRLIFADWLEEQGFNSRAEFIRLQIQRESLEPGTVPWGHLRHREKKLISAHSNEWFGSSQGKLMSRKFKRGFIHTARVNAYALAREPEALFFFGPIEKITLERTGDFQRWGAEALLAPELAYISSLRVNNFRLQPDDIVRLANSPGVRHLRYLDLSRNHVDTKGVEAIARSPHFKRLQKLELHNVGLAYSSIEELFHSPLYPRLKAINATFGYHKFDEPSRQPQPATIRQP